MASSGFAFGFFLALGFAAVVKFLALGHGQLAFGNAVAEVDLQRDHRHALLLRLDQQPLDFAPIQQQLALAERIVVARPAGQVLRDVAVYQPRLADANFGIGLAERPLALPEGLDLGADKHEAGFEFIKEMVIVGGGAILSDDLDAFPVLFLFRAWPHGDAMISGAHDSPQVAAHLHFLPARLRRRIIGGACMQRNFLLRPRDARFRGVAGNPVD